MILGSQRGFWRWKANTDTDTGMATDTSTDVVYKVVITLGLRNRMCSPDSPLAVEYRIGKWSQAPVGGLFAFSSLAAAKRYAGQDSRLVLKCLARGKMEPPKRNLILRFDDETDISSVGLKIVTDAWTGPPHADPPHFPRGTVCYRKLKPIEIVVNSST